MSRRVAGWLAASLLTATAAAQMPVDAVADAMKKRTDAERQAAAGVEGRRVWDGVMADRSSKTVVLFAAATSIQATDPVEFFVTPVTSGKDYESLAVTIARPSDVRAALGFIGLTPGRPIDFAADRFWARGPRVVVRFAHGNQVTRAEDLVVDSRMHKPLPRTGLVFAGSFENPADVAGGVVPPRLAADDADAKPLAPLYNDPAALLELPRQALQSAIYGSQKPSPAAAYKPGDAIDISITPASGADAVEVTDLAIRVEVKGGRVHYAARVGATATDADDLPHLLASIAALADGSRDLFTTTTLDAAVPVVDVRKLYAVLQSVEQDRGVKLDAPPPGGLSHRAFFPDPAWRNRSTRLGEPWELFLTREQAGRLVGRLERQVEEPGAEPRQTVQTFDPADPAAMAAHVRANASQWSKALFVYPPADLTCGELMAWVGPARGTLPRVFVFPPDAATPRPSTAASAKE